MLNKWSEWVKYWTSYPLTCHANRKSENYVYFCLVCFPPYIYRTNFLSNLAAEIVGTGKSIGGDGVGGSWWQGACDIQYASCNPETKTLKSVQNLLIV